MNSGLKALPPAGRSGKRKLERPLKPPQPLTMDR